MKFKQRFAQKILRWKGMADCRRTGSGTMLARYAKMYSRLCAPHLHIGLHNRLCNVAVYGQKRVVFD